MVLPPDPLSITVAVQVLAAPIGADEGEHATVVCVDRAFGVVALTVAVGLGPLLPAATVIVADLDPNVCGLKVTVNGTD